jgi:hypothetical protein
MVAIVPHLTRSPREVRQAQDASYVIEGAGKVYGMAGAEKALAAVLCNYSGKN